MHPGKPTYDGRLAHLFGMDVWIGGPQWSVRRAARGYRPQVRGITSKVVSANFLGRSEGTIRQPAVTWLPYLVQICVCPSSGTNTYPRRCSRPRSSTDSRAL